MPFESTRLYVQLPCEGTSVVEKPAQVVQPTFCPFPSIAVFKTVAQCALVSDTRMGLGDPDAVLVSPEALGQLRHALEMRLAMVKDAEAALARRTAPDGGQ